MFLLQSSAVEIGSGVISLATCGLVLRLSFGAGRMYEKVEDIDKRVKHLEGAKCPHEECPVKATFELEK